MKKFGIKVGDILIKKQFGSFYDAFMWGCLNYKEFEEKDKLVGNWKVIEVPNKPLKRGKGHAYQEEDFLLIKELGKKLNPGKISLLTGWSLQVVKQILDLEKLPTFFKGGK